MRRVNQQEDVMGGRPWGLVRASVRIGALAACAWCWSHNAAAEGTPKSDPAGAIDVTISGSRLQLTAGTGLAIEADIANTSNATIYLVQRTSELILPPELDPPPVDKHWAYFPSRGKETDGNNGLIAIKPGEVYPIFWYPKSLPASVPPATILGKLTAWASGGLPQFLRNVRNEINSELNFIFFPPGDYKITVVATYWTDPARPEDDYHIVTQSKMLNFAAPQFVVLAGSAIGGVIGYFIFPSKRRRALIARQAASNVRDWMALRAAKTATAWTGAALLSMIVTILLSRVSESQFLIRVTVADFWGAIAVGFAANYGGTALLDRWFAKSDSGAHR